MLGRSIVGIIPARLHSVRFPNKLVKQIQGKPLIQYVYENARRASALERVIVACDDESIRRSVESFGGEAFLTSRDHQSGTERIGEVAKRLSCGIVVNIQGDEPLMNTETIDEVALALKQGDDCVMATACVRKNDPDEFENHNVVKVVKDARARALYFSRAPIPWNRDGKGTFYLKHLGIYAYVREFLLEYASLPPSDLERREQLEQLRALDNGFHIKVVETPHDSIGVDTEADFEMVKTRILSTQGSGVAHA